MLKRLSVFIIHLYQKYVSAYTPASCRYQPTCSNYMQIAIEQFEEDRLAVNNALNLLKEKENDCE